MKLLNWKTAPQRNHERATGIWVLVLILLLLHVLKPAPYRHGAETLPCEGPVFVQIQGEVRHPGVYAFCDPPTLAALIQKAGGLQEGAFALPDQRLSPNSGISVTRAGGALRVEPQEVSSFHKITLGLPISVNRESEEGLTALPGVGRNTARAIVEERAKRGGFKSLDELMEIPGIGPRLHVRMKPYLTL
ncbi:MAG: helix-hairpin-helix domain-containing protein [Desulfobacterota bacterium]|jgi:competence protein ComEA|nr:helix-hairpin-helix domain-containing protein [Thermodesulfobacteriota bacterium]